MKKRFEETERFLTRSLEGAECYIVELTTFGHIHADATPTWRPVNRIFRTAGGQPVQLRQDGAYVVVKTGIRFERV